MMHILLSLTSGQFFFLLLNKFNYICKQSVHVTITSTHHFINLFLNYWFRNFVMGKIGHLFRSSSSDSFYKRKDSAYLGKVLLETIMEFRNPKKGY